MNLLACTLAALLRLRCQGRWSRYADQLLRWEQHPAHVRDLFEGRLDYHASGARRGT